VPSRREAELTLGAIVARALFYALLATILVLYAPMQEHVFIYQGF
jgi:hypothetical protein